MTETPFERRPSNDLSCLTTRNRQEVVLMNPEPRGKASAIP